MDNSDLFQTSVNNFWSFIFFLIFRKNYFSELNKEATMPIFNQGGNMSQKTKYAKDSGPDRGRGPLRFLISLVVFFFKCCYLYGKDKAKRVLVFFEVYFTGEETLRGVLINSPANLRMALKHLYELSRDGTLHLVNPQIVGWPFKIFISKILSPRLGHKVMAKMLGISHKRFDVNLNYLFQEVNAAFFEGVLAVVLFKGAEGIVLPEGAHPGLNLAILNELIFAIRSQILWKSLLKKKRYSEEIKKVFDQLNTKSFSETLIVLSRVAVNGRNAVEMCLFLEDLVVKTKAQGPFGKWSK
jgi:hypothetical protein